MDLLSPDHRSLSGRGINSRVDDLGGSGSRTPTFRPKLRAANHYTTAHVIYGRSLNKKLGAVKNAIGKVGKKDLWDLGDW